MSEPWRNEPTSFDQWAKFSPQPAANAKSSADPADQWAAFNPTKAKQEADVVKDVAVQVASNVPKGMAGTMDFLEYTSAATLIPRLAKDYLGAPSWSDALAKVYEPPKPETKAGEYGATVGETIGGSVIPGVGWLGAARGIAAKAVAEPAKGLLRRMGQSAAIETAKNPGRSVLYDLASATTSGIASQSAKDLGFGPGIQTTAGVLGGFAPVVPTLAAQPFRKARAYYHNRGETGAYNRFANELPGTVDEFVDHVAVAETGRSLDNQRKTLAILGEEMEKAVSSKDPRLDEAARILAERRGIDIGVARNDIARRDATASTIARLVEEDGIKPDAAKARIRNLTSAHADNPLNLAEETASIPSKADIRKTSNIDDLDPRRIASPGNSGAHYLIDDLANNAGRSSFTTRNAIEDRNLGMRDVARQKIEELAPQVSGSKDRMTPEHIPELIDNARLLARKDYDVAHRAPTNQAVIDELPDILNKHYGIVGDRMGETADTLRNALQMFTVPSKKPGDTNRVAMYSMQQLQDARGDLRQMIDTAEAAGTKGRVVATLQSLYDDVTNVMTRANPDWAVANRKWADMNIMKEADKLGVAFGEKAGPKFRDHVNQYRQLAPEIQDIVKVNWLQKTFDKLDNLGDSHDISKHLRTDHFRNAVREFFGDDAVIKIAQISRDAAIATKSGRMLGNSATHFRGQRQLVADADTGILPSMESAVKEGPKKAMLAQMWAVLSENINRPLSRITTTPMNDTAEVARHLHNMKRAKEFIDGLRSARNMPTAPPVVSSGIGSYVASDRQQ